VLAICAAVAVDRNLLPGATRSRAVITWQAGQIQKITAYASAPLALRDKFVYNFGQQILNLLFSLFGQQT
jgi:hypothetical protein